MAARGGTARHRPHTPDHCPISGRLGVGQAAFRALLPSPSLRSARSGVCASCACVGPLTGQRHKVRRAPEPETLARTDAQRYAHHAHRALHSADCNIQGLHGHAAESCRRNTVVMTLHPLAGHVHDAHTTLVAFITWGPSTTRRLQALTFKSVVTHTHSVSRPSGHVKCQDAPKKFAGFQD